MRKSTLCAAAVGLGGLFSAHASGQVLLNEIEPNPFGSDPQMQQVELRGTPGATFTGCFVSIDTDTDSPTFDRATPISVTFDANGLAVVSVNDLENPSFTVAVCAQCPPIFTLFDPAQLGEVFDAVNIPDSTLDVNRGVADVLGGINLAYSGDEPILAFRDRDSGDWYLVNDFSGVVYDASGVAIDASSFIAVGNPLLPSFGAPNPFIEDPFTIADLTTTGATLPGQPGYGIPDGEVNLDDLGYFIRSWLNAGP